jgi:predicted ester cyclase
MSDARVARVQVLLDRFSEGEIDAVEELVATEFFAHVPAEGEPTATNEFRRYAAELKAAAPDLSVRIPDLSAGSNDLLEGNAVIAGTWQRELWGAPPTGERYEFTVPVRLRPVEDRYAFELGLDAPGALTILRSLGLVNPPDQMHLPPPYPVVLDDLLIKVMFTGQVADKPCPHLADVTVVSTRKTACDSCDADEIWPALRLCLSCGHVGCCDTSVNKHAKAHWESTGHPLMRSIRMDEGWMWCYEDNAAFQKRTLERIAARLGEVP